MVRLTKKDKVLNTSSVCGCKIPQELNTDCASSVSFCDAQLSSGMDESAASKGFGGYDEDAT